MSRPRLSDDPMLIHNFVTDPIREAEIVTGLKEAISYVMARYAAAKQLELDRKSFNAAVAEFRTAVDRGGKILIKNHWLTFFVLLELRSLAGVLDDEPLLNVSDEVRSQAVRNVRSRVKALRGKPGKDLLRCHVLATVALLQEAAGKRVMAPREKNSVYEPHLSGSLGAAHRVVVDKMEPGTTDSELPDWIRKDHKRRAGKPMKIDDYVPGFSVRKSIRIVPHHRDAPGKPQFEVFPI